MTCPFRFSTIAGTLLAIVLLAASAPFPASTASVSSVAYTYDADGIRIQKTVDGTDVTNYLVDTNRPYAQVLEERDGSDALQVSYIYGDDLISQKRAGVDSYYHYDGQMSTRALSDSSETVTDTYTYDAFGNLLGQTGTTENNYLYTGEQYDPNVGFYYLRARYYDAGVGRFITTDPWSGSVSDPASLHKYLYTSANPVNNWDPSGEQYDLNSTLVMTDRIGVQGARNSIGIGPYLKYLDLSAALSGTAGILVISAVGVILSRTGSNAEVQLKAIAGGAIPRGWQCLSSISVNIYCNHLKSDKYKKYKQAGENCEHKHHVVPIFAGGDNSVLRVLDCAYHYLIHSEIKECLPIKKPLSANTKPMILHCLNKVYKKYPLCTSNTRCK